MAPEVVRLAGADRWETSRAVARDMRGTQEAQMVSLATGGDFPDALSAGPAVAALGGSLVLVGNTLAPGMAEAVLRNEPALIIAVGGAQRRIGHRTRARASHVQQQQRVDGG